MKEYKDGTLIAKIIIKGCPRTKKNSNRLIKTGGRSRILPSKIFMDYQKHCEPYMLELKNTIGESIDYGISVKVCVATDSWRLPDHVNVCQAVFDIMQHFKVVTNDSWIHIGNGLENHWFIGVDKENPRLELEIRRFRHLKEEFNHKKKK